MSQVVPRKVDSYLAVGELQRRKFMVYNLTVGFHALCFQNESRIPLSDILVDDEHLEMSVRRVVVE